MKKMGYEYVKVPQSEVEPMSKKVKAHKRVGFIMYLTMVLGLIMFVLLSLLGSSDPIKEYANSTATQDTPSLLLISIDGFRYDYIRRGLTPNLLKLAREGVMGPMKPQFPSYTFPNHYTLVTGRYPESHGIVGNSFYDPKFNEYFSYTNQTQLRESKWWQSEPIWNRVQEYGMKSGTMFWPGSESRINGRRPNYYREYDGTVSTKSRVDQIFEWMDLKDNAPKFLAMYLSVVDDAGHNYGPDSPQVDAALIEVDKGIAYLMKGLKERGNNVNVVIVSDHGMIEVKPDWHIYLDDLIEDYESRLVWVDFGPVASIISVKGETERVYQELLAKQKGRHYRVYKRENLPAKYHYKNNERIAPIIVVSEPGWIVDYKGGNWVPRGVHGYDPEDPDMRAIFIAAGPSIKAKKAILSEFANLDVYPFMCYLLDMPAQPNNGSLQLVNQCIIMPMKQTTSKKKVSQKPFNTKLGYMRMMH